MKLTCKCGHSEDGLTDNSAYDAGWRLKSREPICPKCAARLERQSIRKLARRYGAENAARAIRQVDALIGK